MFKAAFAFLRCHSALAVASALGIGLLAARTTYFLQGAYLFFAWNLTLAWLPLVFATWAVKFAEAERRTALWIAGGLWLLFLPNAPYLVTDLVHWRIRPPVPPWLDLLMCFHFAWLGVALGFASLRLMEAEVARQRGTATAHAFAAACLFLTSLGIYLGRFRRWNSWDIFHRPGTLFERLADDVVNPWDNRRIWAFTLIWGTFLASAYWALNSRNPALRESHANRSDNPQNP